MLEPGRMMEPFISHLDYHKVIGLPNHFPYEGPIILSMCSSDMLQLSQDKQKNMKNTQKHVHVTVLRFGYCK